MPDIFDEIEEEVRAERFRRFLSRYAGLLIALVIIIIAGIAAWRLWDAYQTRQDQRAAVLYLTALNQVRNPNASKEVKEAGASELIQLAQNAPAGYRALARLHAAALLVKQGKTAEALNVYNALASDTSADPLLRDLATLLWTERQIDTGDPRVLEARLKPLAASDSPWRSLAERQLALLDLRQNKVEAARTILQRLSTEVGAPAGVRESAQLLLQQTEGTR